MGKVPAVRLELTT